MQLHNYIISMDRTKGFFHFDFCISLCCGGFFFLFFIFVAVLCWIVDLSYVPLQNKTTIFPDMNILFHLLHADKYKTVLHTSSSFATTVGVTISLPSTLFTFSSLINTCRKNKYRQNFEHSVFIWCACTLLRSVYRLFYDLINFYTKQNKYEGKEKKIL